MNNEPKYTKIPNELMDALMNKALNETEKAIVLFIARKTYGFNKESDQISLTQFERKLGYARTSINRALKRLVAVGLLVKLTTLGKKGRYGLACNEWKINHLNIQYDALVAPAQLVALDIKKVVAPALHTKESITKERETEKSINKKDTEFFLNKQKLRDWMRKGGQV